MKIAVLLVLISITLAILDRSYYDALGILSLIENFQWVLAKKKLDKLSERYLKSIIQTGTQVLGSALGR